VIAIMLKISKMKRNRGMSGCLGSIKVGMSHILEN